MSLPRLQVRARRADRLTDRPAARRVMGFAARSTPCFRVENSAGRAKLYVYDVIGGFDLDAATFVQAVHQITDPVIDLHVNSPGGFVFDAVSMFEALRGHPAKVFTHIDGLAASAASFLALAGDDIDIARGGRMLIHDAQGVAIGSPAEVHEYGDLLDTISDDIAGFYADRAGGSPASWRTAMRATTQYSAQQSVDVGLVDRVAGDATSARVSVDARSQLIRARHAVRVGQGPTQDRSAAVRARHAGRVFRSRG